jgi:hypothetical protein
MPLWMGHSKLERGGQRISSCGIPISRRTTPWTAHERGARHGRLLPGLAQPIGDGQPARVTHEAAVLVDAVSLNPNADASTHGGARFFWPRPLGVGQGTLGFNLAVLGVNRGFCCRLLDMPGGSPRPQPLKRLSRDVHALAYAQRVPDHGPPAKLQESTLR